MSGNLPGSPLEVELSPTFDDDNHNGVSLFDEPSHMLESGENQPAGLEIQEPSSAPGEPEPYPMSDDEGGVLSDGGVQLDISQAHPESVDIDTEMTSPGAEGNSDLYSSPENHISPGNDDNETTNGTVGDESDIPQPSWSQEGGPGVAYHIASLINEISGLTQQIHDTQDEHPELQHIQQEIEDLQQLQTLQASQGGQEQGEQPAAPHEMAYDPGTSLPFC